MARLIIALEQGGGVDNYVSDSGATTSATSDVRALTNGQCNTFYQNGSVLIVPTVLQDSQSNERCESSGCTYSSNTGQ